MHFESLDIIIEGRNDTVFLFLSGPFRKEFIPHMREKFSVLLEDGNRRFMVNMEDVTSIDDSAVQMFLKLLNAVKAKGGELGLIFKNETLTRAFAPFLNLIPVYPDDSTAAPGGILASLRRRGILLSRKTGIRISRPVAIFVLVVLCGWFVTLLFIIRLQNRNLKEQQHELYELSTYKQRAIIEINRMQERLRPLEQLGIVKDTIQNQP
ncbi:MAG TPA: STAS domain-containing protein [Chitinispirillaceae bacterium]|nr:STAS domain-containing protein [Chitinispirillaceae bacterium]